MLYSEIFKLLLKWFLGPVGEYQTHTTRSVGSNPTHGVEVSGAEFATEVGDGGGELYSVHLEWKEKILPTKFFLHHMMQLLIFLLSRNRIILSFSCFQFLSNLG